MIDQGVMCLAWWTPPFKEHTPSQGNQNRASFWHFVKHLACKLKITSPSSRMKMAGVAWAHPLHSTTPNTSQLIPKSQLGHGLALAQFVAESQLGMWPSPYSSYGQFPTRPLAEMRPSTRREEERKKWIREKRKRKGEEEEWQGVRRNDTSSMRA